MRQSKFNIQEYSAFAVCFLLIQDEGAAEAVYTDIPDTVINHNAETFWLDLDDSGTMDFSFQKQSFDFLVSTYYSGYVTSHFSAIFAEPLIIGDMIAGSTVIWGGSAAGSFVVYHPYAIASGEMINDSLSFQFADDQNMAFRYTTAEGAYFPKGGNWYPEVLDHYLGIYFKDSAGCYHYGWIRCDVKNEGKELVIMDFAYESKCETGIVAGDIIGDTTTLALTESGLIVPTIYSYSGTIVINIDKQLLGAKYSVVNLEGKVISSGHLNELNNKINSIHGDGTFIIIVEQGTYRYSKQILLFQ